MFLAISGLLMVALMVGWTTSLNTQRYKDSIRTFQTFLQQQYNLVYNVENGRDTRLSCAKDNATNELRVVTDETGDDTRRGQSECVMMGRYVHISNGMDIKVYSILGLEPNAADQNNDTQAIKDYLARYVDTSAVGSVGLSDEELEMPWQAIVTGQTDRTIAGDYAIAIIRSPVSGIVHTYVKDITSANSLGSVLSVVDPSNETAKDLCVDAGVPLAGLRDGIRIVSRASSQSGIKSVPNAGAVCNE